MVHSCYTGPVQYQAVLFDMDGVIFDGEPLHYLAARDVLAKYGRAFTYEQYKQYCAGVADRESFSRYFADIGETALPVESFLAEKAAAYMQVATKEPLTPIAATVACIRWLAKRHVPIALVTGSLRPEADLVLNSFAIADAFSAVVTVEDVTHGKPHPEGYLRGAKLLDVRPEHCVVVEDAPSGIAAANAAGIPCIALTTTYPRGKLTAADRIVNALSPKHLQTGI